MFVADRIAMKRTMRLPVAEADSTTGHPKKALKTTKQQSASSPKTIISPSKNENLLQKLILGIESNDMDIVASVFNGQVEPNVMRDLPLPSVMPLLKLIRKKVARKSVKSIHHLDWLESLIQCKLSYLVSCQNIDSEIGYLLDSLNVKVDIFDRVIQLQGKLDLLMAQVNSNDSSNTAVSMQSLNSSITKMKAKTAYRDPDESDEEDEEAVEEEEGDDDKANDDDKGKGKNEEKMDVAHDEIEIEKNNHSTR